MKHNFEKLISDALLKHQSNEVIEPLSGHEERFETRMLQHHAKKRMHRIPKWPVLALAAASAIGVIIFIVVSEIKKTNLVAQKAKLSDVSAEMAALEDYYASRLHLDMNDQATNDKNIQRFMSDIKRLETEYQKLEENLGRNFNNERIAQAMVNNYKFRLQLMEQLQRYIEIQNRINTQINEQKLSS